VDEGVDRVLTRVRERGVDAVTLAVAYHQARDLTPRSPLRRLVYRQDGVFVPLLKAPHVVRVLRRPPPGRPIQDDHGNGDDAPQSAGHPVPRRARGQPAPLVGPGRDKAGYRKRMRTPTTGG
jgi:hypothetical protein